MQIHFRQNSTNAWSSFICGFYGSATASSLCCFGNVLHLCSALIRKNWCCWSECSRSVGDLLHASLKYSCYYLSKSYYCLVNSLVPGSFYQSYKLSVSANSRMPSACSPYNFAQCRSFQGKNLTGRTLLWFLESSGTTGTEAADGHGHCGSRGSAISYN